MNSFVTLFDCMVNITVVLLHIFRYVTMYLSVTLKKEITIAIAYVTLVNEHSAYESDVD